MVEEAWGSAGGQEEGAAARAAVDMGWEITGWLNLKSDALQQRVNQQTKHKREEHAALKAFECWSAAPDGGAGGGVGGVEAQKLYGQLLDLRESRSLSLSLALMHARSLSRPPSLSDGLYVSPPSTP